MKAMISDTANDYQQAAEARYQKTEKASGAAAHDVVDAYVGKQAKAFAPRPRAETEKFIDACPQTDD